MLSRLIDPARRECQARFGSRRDSDHLSLHTSMGVPDTTLPGHGKGAGRGRFGLVGGKPSLADLGGAALPSFPLKNSDCKMMYAQARPGVAAWLARWRGRRTYEATMPGR